MIPIINEIKGYDEYVKDYEEKAFGPGTVSACG